MDIKQKVDFFNGWINREENNLQSELKAATSIEMINYINGKIYELALIKELMPRNMEDAQ